MGTRKLSFFDCNTMIGCPAAPAGQPYVDARGLVAAMDVSGIAKAIVWHVAQRDADVTVGNELVTQAIALHTDRLLPCWSILPNQTGELGRLDDWFASASRAGVVAFRAWPDAGRYLLRAVAIGDVFEQVSSRRIPYIHSIAASGGSWGTVYDLLADFPQLTLIISDVGCWGPDRFFRPLIEQYPRVYLEISDYTLPGGIEAFTERYGPERLLFGTHFPTQHHGGAMLQLAHAEISDEAKSAIACGNLDRLVREARQ